VGITRSEHFAFLSAFQFFNPPSDPCDRFGIRRQLPPLRRNPPKFRPKVWRSLLGSCLPVLCHEAVFVRLQCKRAPLGFFDPPRVMQWSQIFRFGWPILSRPDWFAAFRALLTYRRHFRLWHIGDSKADQGTLCRR